MSPDQLYLSRTDPDGVYLQVGHTRTGSHLSQYEYCERTGIVFDVLVTRDAIAHEWWPALWSQAEEIGLGALRSQSFGKFDLLSWEEVDPLSPAPVPD